MVWFTDCLDKTIADVWSVIPYHVKPRLRIYHECDGGIEKYVPRITVCHYEACRVMINCDSEGPIFLSHPHTNNEFFLLTIDCFFQNKLPKVPEYAEMQHHMMMSF